MFLKVIEFFIYLGIVILISYLINAKSYLTLPYVSNVWYTDIKKAAVSVKKEELTHYPVFENRFYYYKKNIFYYGNNGDILHKVYLDPQSLATISSRNYITYYKVGDLISMFSKEGSKQWSLNTYSYPFLSFSGNRFLLLSTDNTSFKLYDLDRNLIYQNNFLGTMILDFVFCPFNDNLFLGTSDGKVLLVNYNGEELFSRSLEGSKHNIIKSTAISENSKYLATVSGIFPEYLSVFNVQGKLLWQKKNNFNHRRRTSIFLDEHNKLLLEQGEKSIIARELTDGKILYELDFTSYEFTRIKYLKFHSIKGFIIIMLNSNLKNYIFLSNPDGKILWQRDYQDDFLLACEIAKMGMGFLAQSTDYIYCYQMINFF